LITLEPIIPTEIIPMFEVDKDTTSENSTERREKESRTHDVIVLEPVVEHLAITVTNNKEYSFDALGLMFV